MILTINYNNSTDTLSQIEKMIESNHYSLQEADIAVRYLSYYGNSELFFRVIKWESEYLSINNIDKTTYRNILMVNDNEPLVNAIGSNNLDLVKFLVASGIDPKIPNNIHLGSYVGLAAFDGHYDMLVYMVEELGINHRLDDDSAFIGACQKGHVQCAKFLFEKGVNIMAKNNGALLSACENQHIEAVKFLLNNGAILPSTTTYTKKIGNNFTIEVKMHSKEELNLQNILNKVANTGNIEIMKLFVEHGVKINLYSKCISWAIGNNQKDMMHYLEDNGADITQDEGFLINHVQNTENFELLIHFVKRGLSEEYLEKYQTKDIERFLFSYKLDTNIPEKQKNNKKTKI